MRRTLGLAVLLATLLLSAGVAFAHGGEDEALEKTRRGRSPSRRSPC